MNYLSMGIPSNYISHPLYQQYAQLLMQSAQMTQNMMLQKQQALAKQQALYQQKAIEQAEQLEKQQLLEEQAAAEAEAKMAEAEKQAMAAAGPKDGHDDGKISFGSKLKNMGKGVVNFFKGMVCDENGKFSLKRTLTTVGIAAGATALTIATGGAATPFLIAAGTTLGAVEVGKGAYKAATAKTDAEAEAAWQNIGSGATAIVGSVAGAKSALKSAKVDVSGYKGVTGAIKATGKTFKYSYDKVGAGISHVKTNGFANSINTAKTALVDNFKAGWESAFKSTNAKDNVKASIEAKYDAKIAKVEAKIEALSKEIGTLESATEPNTVLITQKKNQLASILHDKVLLESKKSSIPVDVKVKNNKAQIDKLSDDIEELKFIKQTLPEADITAIENELAAKISLRNRLIDQQTVAGVRKVQIERLQANKVNLETMIKNPAFESQKSAFQKQLDNVNARIAEVEKFAKIENAQQSVIDAKSKISRCEAVIKGLTSRIEDLKNNTTLSVDVKSQKIIELTTRLEKATKILNDTKGVLNQCKRLLHWENAKIFEAANRKSLGYPTVSLTGGGVITQDNINVADAYAKAYGFNSAEEMQKALDAENAKYSKELANANKQQSSTAKTSSVTTQSNPYATQNLFAGNGSNNLSFDDLYVSPYPEYV